MTQLDPRLVTVVSDRDVGTDFSGGGRVGVAGYRCLEALVAEQPARRLGPVRRFSGDLPTIRDISRLKKNCIYPRRNRIQLFPSIYMRN
jgi:hypothetical protein